MRIGSASPSNPRTRSVGRATSPSGGHTVLRLSNLRVRHQSGQPTHEHDCIVGYAWTVPAGRIQPLLHVQLSVIAALPVQDRMNDRAVAAHDDLRDRSAQNPLRVAGVAAGCDQARSRSAPSARSCCRSGSPSGGGRRAIMAPEGQGLGEVSCAARYDRNWAGMLAAMIVEGGRVRVATSQKKTEFAHALRRLANPRLDKEAFLANAKVVLEAMGGTDLARGLFNTSSVSTGGIGNGDFEHDLDQGPNAIVWKLRRPKQGGL